MMSFILFLIIVFLGYTLNQSHKDKARAAAKLLELEAEVKRGEELLNRRDGAISTLKGALKRLEPFAGVADADDEAKQIISRAEQQKSEIEMEAKKQSADMLAKAMTERDEVNRQSRERRARVEELMRDANAQSERIIATAVANAEKIAGDAYRAMREADDIQKTATAMNNLIQGYGDQYLKPTFGLLDELAELYSFDDAGKELKQARERTKMLVENQRAASCEYVESHRRTTAIHFVLDAFNGKVDTILTRTKQDNFGTLEQQINDAFAVVNHHGAAFRDARVTDEYLHARMQELRWAVAIHAIREREREEQREIRERIREEECARREIEKALKEAAKEEEAIEKVMAKMRLQIEKASAEQKESYEAQLIDLQQRLAEAEAKSQRAISMAQQTRAGHVYIISNVGAFGENVYKVGMTRRLEPNDRVRELGDASVPFQFDVHAMIWSENAPALERALHMEFIKMQLNKVNPRKEFFRVSIKELRDALERRGIEVSWTMTAAAAEFRESLAIEERMKLNPALEREWISQQAGYEIQEEARATEVAADVGLSLLVPTEGFAPECATS